MDAHPGQHPSEQTLKSYALGALDDAAAQAVHEHLEGCARCRHQVAEMAPDSFVARVREARQEPEASDAANASPFAKHSAPTAADDDVIADVSSPRRSVTGQVGAIAGTENGPATIGLPAGTRVGYFGDYELLRVLGEGGMAVATEAQYKTTYNISIVALEEAKGTLLEYDQITVVEGPKSAMSVVAVPDGATRPSFFEPWGVTPPPVASMPAAPPPLGPAPPTPIPPSSGLSGIEPQPKDSPTKADFGGKTFSFEMTLKIGSQPVEIRGSFAIAPVRSGDAPKR